MSVPFETSAVDPTVSVQPSLLSIERVSEGGQLTHGTPRSIRPGGVTLSHRRDAALVPGEKLSGDGAEPRLQPRGRRANLATQLQ